MSIFFSKAQAASLPDLIVTGFSMSPAAPVAGQAVKFTATIKNQGAGPTPVGVIIGVLFSVDGAPITWSDTDSTSLAAGASVTLTANSGPAGSATWTATTGTHALQVQVNDINRFAETSITNNTLAQSVIVKAPAPTAHFSATPASVASGGSSTLNWSSTNATACTASGAWSGAKAVSGSQTLTNLLATGTYTLTCTGPGGSVAPAVTINVAASALPDVIITGFSMSPAVPVAGQAVKFSATVKNQGAGPTPAGVVIGVLFSIDGAPVTWSDTTSNSLAAGASINVTANSGPTASATWPATSGSHTLQVQVNDVNRFAETNTTNNTSSRTFSVAATTAPAPTASLAASPSSISSGSSATLTWGSANATSCVGSGFSTGNAVSGSVAVKPTVTTTYAMNCSGPGGSVSKSVVVTVTAVIAGADPCLPFAAPSADAVLNSSKRVFAHYFYPIPLSIDNLPAASDYYTVNYLNPHGEGDKFLGAGGLLRERPLPVTPNSDPNWQILNMQKEVKLAIARGVNGFTFDTMSTDDVSATGKLTMMLKAAAAVDARFKIALMPDMYGLSQDVNKVMTLVKAVYSHPSIFRLADGRIVLAPFATESVPASSWASLLTQFKQQGLNVAFLPTFGSLAASIVDPYLSVEHVGLGNFGNPGTPDQLSWAQGSGAYAHANGPLFFAGLDPQSYKPQSFMYAEASNSLAYRNAWTGVMQAKADMIQVVTWNDMGESTAIEPLTSQYGDTGNGFYNLTGYYSTWFKTGVQPTIDHDVLYYFYRKMPTTAAAPNQSQPMVQQYPQTAQNQIELLAFLTAPGKLSITIGGQTYTKDAPAGMTSFLVPTAAGIPTFGLSRNSSSVIQFQGKTQIYGNAGLPTGVLDFTYWSGSASSSGVCNVQMPQ